MTERVVDRKNCTSCEGFMTMVHIHSCYNCGAIEWVMVDKEKWKKKI